jgi:hypothetical protein
MRSDHQSDRECISSKKYPELLEDWEQRWQQTSSFLSATMDFSPNQGPYEIRRVFAPVPNGKTVVVKVQSGCNLSLRKSLIH